MRVVVPKAGKCHWCGKVTTYGWATGNTGFTRTAFARHPKKSRQGKRVGRRGEDRKRASGRK